MHVSGGRIGFVDIAFYIIKTTSEKDKLIFTGTPEYFDKIKYNENSESLYLIVRKLCGENRVNFEFP